MWNERVLNKQILHDGDVIRTETTNFIKQQEYRKTGEFIITSTKNGDIRKKTTIASIEEKFHKIQHIGDEEDYGISVFDNIDHALRKEFRQTIATGVGVIDTLTGGGLGKGEIGVILTPSGVGKTTLLTKIANTAYDECKNVCQIIFEDTKEQIQRKHFTIWSNIALSKTDENCELVKQLTYKKASEMVGKGNLIIKRFSQENTTMMDIRNWMLRHQKKYGYKFDILVLDYLDCLESHKKTPDRNEAELVIIKSFEALAADFDIPAWTAIQTNRSGFNAEYVEAYQSGGSIKRVQKAHFFMSVAKTADQKEANLASIRIIKARFAQDGQTFTDCIFNNDTMQIIIEDKRYPVRTILKHHDSEDVNEINNTANEIIKKSSDMDMHAAINKRVISLTEMVNDPTINDDPVDLKQFEKITEKKDVEIINMHIETTRNDLSTNESENDNGLIEIDENDVVSDAVNEGVNEGVNNITNPLKKDDLLDWSGKTETVKTNEIEIKLEDLPSKGMNLEKNIIVEEVKFSPPKEKIIQEKIILSREEIEEAEKNMKNPDEPSTEHMTMHERLKLAEMHQNLMKKK